MYRNNYEGGDGWRYYPLEIEIGENCPMCGEKRGTPEWHNQTEDGEFYQLHIWKNHCGHLDAYRDCYLESKRLKHERQD